MSSVKKLTLPHIASIGKGDVRELTVLKADKLGIQELDDDLSACVELRRLDLSHNALAKVDALGDLKQLSWLNLRNNKLRALKGLDTLEQLITLNAGNNHILRITHLGALPALKALILNNNDIKVIDGLRNFRSLTALVLSHNAIEEIDEIELKPLTELRKLSLSHNLLRTVPNLSYCFNLKELRLNDNKLMTLPESLVQCAHLCLLDVGNNQITSLDKISGILGQLKFLQNLNLRKNPLVEKDNYAEEIRKILPSLHVLDDVNIRGKRSTKERLAEASKASKDAPNRKTKDVAATDKRSTPAPTSSAPAPKRAKVAKYAMNEGAVQEGQTPVPASGTPASKRAKIAPKSAVNGDAVPAREESKAAGTSASPEKMTPRAASNATRKSPRTSTEPASSENRAEVEKKPLDSSKEGTRAAPEAGAESSDHDNDGTGGENQKEGAKRRRRKRKKAPATAPDTGPAANEAESATSEAKVPKKAEAAQNNGAGALALNKVNPEISGALKIVDIKRNQAKGKKGGKADKRKTPSLDLDQLVRDPTALLGTGTDGW